MVKIIKKEKKIVVKAVKAKKKKALSARDKKIRQLHEEIVERYAKDFEELAKN